MNLDFSYGSGHTVEQVGEKAGKHHRVETWALQGSAGDRVLIDAYVPDEVERIVVMGVGLLTQLPEYAMGIIMVASVVTIAQRTAHVRRNT